MENELSMKQTISYRKATLSRKNKVHTTLILGIIQSWSHSMPAAVSPQLL